MSHRSESYRREFTPVSVSGENFIPVQNIATVSCKGGTNTSFGMNLTSGWTGMGGACVNFVNPNGIYLINVKCVFM